MDANYVLIWIVGLSSVTWTVRFLQLYRLRRPSWLLAGGLVIASLAIGLLAAPGVAGYVSGVVWALVMFVPLLLNRQVVQLMARQRFAAAARLSRLVALLHPSRDWRLRHRNLRAMELMRRGELEPARRLFESIQASPTVLARHATLQLFRLERRWGALVTWIDDQPVTQPGLFRDPAALGLYLRALGELGETERMVRTLDELSPAQRAAHGALSRRMLALFVLALGGRPDPVRRLLEGPLARFDEPIRRFWRGTALQRAGRAAEAAKELEPVLLADDRMLVDTARDRLDNPLEPVDTNALGPAVSAALDRVADEADEEVEASLLGSPGARRPAFVTAGVLAVLLVAYLVEIPGGTTDPLNLIRLGALIGPPVYLEGEYWRVVTAGLLHFGAVHLTLNLVGVWYFGRFLERIVGPWRFLAIYAATGVGAMALILVWSELVGGEPFLLVGASASLMGIVGASAAVLLQRWRRRPTRRARRQLLFLALIVALQTVFDLVTPQVSFAAHFGGAVIGFVLGAVLGTNPAPATTAPAASSTRS